MGNLDLNKIKELIGQECESGDDCEVVRETEWRYVFKTGSGKRCMISKFLADDSFQVSVGEVRRRWPTMSESERLEFSANFWDKKNWIDNDTAILEFLMQEGNDLIWIRCSLAFLKHPDRDRAVEFLLDRIDNWQLKNDPLNYIQALGMLGDHRATRAIRPYYEKYRRQMELEADIGVPEDVFSGPIRYSSYFAVCGALLKIEGSPEFESAISEYLNHSNEQVRWWAENALGVEGPTTIKRRAGYAAKRQRQTLG
jgi:hypothetical protein